MLLARRVGFMHRFQFDAEIDAKKIESGIVRADFRAEKIIERINGTSARLLVPFTRWVHYT